MDDFVIARNPEPGSTLPYLIRLPLPRPVVLKARDTWPRTAKVYCHRAEEWPDEPEVVERVPVRSCTARGPAVELVLDRGRENRSQLVFTRLKGGREAIFWQSARTNRKAWPARVGLRSQASGTGSLDPTHGVRRHVARCDVSSRRAASCGGAGRPSGDEGGALEDLARVPPDVL